MGAQVLSFCYNAHVWQTDKQTDRQKVAIPRFIVYILFGTRVFSTPSPIEGIHPQFWAHTRLLIYILHSLSGVCTSDRCIFALHGMPARTSDEKSVRPSVKRVHCDKTKEGSVQIFIPYERFSLVFWEEEWLVGRGGATPSTWNFQSTGLRWSEMVRNAHTYRPIAKKFHLTLTLSSRAFQLA